MLTAGKGMAYPNSTVFMVDAQVVGTAAAVQTNSLVYIGNDPAGSQQAGRIDEASIIRGNVGDNDILWQSLVASPRANPPPAWTQCQGYWNFDYTTGRDWSASNNNGTFQGGPAKTDCFFVIPDDIFERDPVTGTPEVDALDAARMETLYAGVPTAAQRAAAILPTFNYRLNTGLGTQDYFQTGDLETDDWLRLTWDIVKQYRLKIQSTPSDASTLGVNVTDLPFLIDDGKNRGMEDLQAGIWVDHGSDVVIGALYRDANRCATLNQVTLADRLFQGIGLESTDSIPLADGSAGGGPSRQVALSRIDDYGQIVFNYVATEFRAEIPVGGFLDASSLSALNAQLVPNLCTVPLPGGMVDIVKGPEGGAQYDQSSNHGGNVPSEESFVWDPALQRVHPLAPGIIRLEWNDGSPLSKTYKITILAGFPTDEELFEWDREQADNEGFRELDANTNFVRSLTFAPVSDAYPASPTGHYRHQTETVAGRRAPVDLDPNPVDRWNFVRLGLSTASALTDGSRFTAGKEGKTVALFSYRPDASEVADGTVSREGYAVRIVESAPGPSTPADLGTLSSNLQQSARFDGGANQHLRISAGGSVEAVSFTDDSETTLEFWARLSNPASNSVPTADRIVYEQSGINTLLQVGFRGPEYPAHPDTFFFEVAPDGGVLNEDFSAAGTLPGPDLEQSTGTAGTFDGTVVTFPGVVESDRSYLRTIAGNFDTGSFVSDVTVTLAGGGGI